MDRGGVTAAWPGREDWPPLQRDLPAAGSAVRTVAVVTADRGPCGQLAEPGLGPPRGCTSRPSMGLGPCASPAAGFSGSSVSEPIKCTFSQNCILSVCLLTPAPWVGPLPLWGPGEERRGQWGSGHVGHSPLAASGLSAANECHFCL